MMTPNAALAQATYDTVWDTFTSGLDPQKWSYVTIGPFVTNDGVITPLSNGMHVGPPARNPSTGLPCFSLTVGQEATNGGLPGQLDHMKWLVYANHMASTGFPGFDAVNGQELSFSTRMTGQTFGTRLHPFGSKASANDVRTAVFAQATIDIETNMVFDFFFTNKRVYVLYERLANGWTEAKKYAAFTFAVPVAARTPDSVHDVKIAYDRAAGTVRWILDGKEVYRVTQIGRHIDRRFMLIDCGGVEETVEMRQLNCGMGLFAILDGSDGSKPGLVRLSGMPGYYFAPSRGEPSPQSFVDETSQPSSRLFGQGAEFRIGAYRVSSQVAGAPAPAPDPISIPSDDSPDGVDGNPNTSPLP
jgi:Family of unknown function (DUF6081)